MLLVDGANVVGSRPTGWWRDRPGAAANLHQLLVQAAGAGQLEAPIVLVLEGAARRGVAAGTGDGVTVVHAGGSGDDTLVELATEARAAEEPVTAVTADRALRDRLGRVGADVVGPRWLLDRL